MSCLIFFCSKRIWIVLLCNQDGQILIYPYSICNKKINNVKIPHHPWKFILNLLSGDEKYYYIGSVNSNNRSVTTKLLQGFQFFLIVYIQSFLEKSSN